MKVLFLSINSAYKIVQIYIHISDDDKLLLLFLLLSKQMAG